MQRTGQTLPCQAPSRPSYIPGHPSLHRRCNTNTNTALSKITANIARNYYVVMVTSLTPLLRTEQAPHGPRLPSQRPRPIHSIPKQT